MNSGSVTAQARSFRDLKEICARADIMMLDHQRRDDDTGFQQNGDTGKRVHTLLGWDKLAPESMALYQSGPGYYRVASKPAAEARMWMIAGIAGGIQPWWHHVAAYHEDRRMYSTAEPVMRWWKANERYLVNRTPIANVGVVWSQRNTDFFGRDAAAEVVDAPYTGFMHALVRARIPYLPIHADDIDRGAAGMKVLILPNVGALSDAQAAAIRRFVQRGGSLFATGATGLYTEWGDARPDFVLADLFGCHLAGQAVTPRATGARGGGTDPIGAFAPSPSGHTYLRLIPELRSRVDGPHIKDEPPASGTRHQVLRGFEETDLLPFGGSLTALRVEATALVPLTFVPPFPTYPPETSWMRQPTSDIPGLVLSEHGASRVAYLPADIDRRYAREHLPDHARLIANIVRWVANETVPLAVDGTGFIDCHLYEQPGRTILHVVNLTSEATWRAPIDELIRVGPFKVTMPVPARSRRSRAPACSCRARRPRSASPAATPRSRSPRSWIMSLSSWSSRLHRGLKTPVPHDSLWAQGLQTLGSRRQPLATVLLAAALTVAPGATSDRVQRAANPKDPALALEIADYVSLPMTGLPDGTGNNAGSLARINVMRQEPRPGRPVFRQRSHRAALHPRRGAAKPPRPTWISTAAVRAPGCSTS